MIHLLAHSLTHTLAQISEGCTRDSAAVVGTSGKTLLSIEFCRSAVSLYPAHPFPGQDREALGGALGLAARARGTRFCGAVALDGAGMLSLRMFPEHAKPGTYVPDAFIFSI